MPEPHADLLVRLLRGTLGDSVLGVYLHGSATLGGLRPHSDLDIPAVVRDPTTHPQRRCLVQELLKVSGPPGSRMRPVELIVVAQGDVRPWRYPPTCEFLYGEWLRADYERGVTPGPEPMPDLAPLLMVLGADARLYGPPPADLIDPVPQEDLRRAVVAGVPQLLSELDRDTRDVLLTLAQVWTTLATGAIRSKDAAADWALQRLPTEHRPVLAHARAVHLGEEAEDWTELWPGVRSCADFLVRGVEDQAP
ncbi:aminoglycoside adenylyltransferase family protein [Streptomyces sp. NPDC019990]|uniref:aminoglycoside adenylyltransferase family protein n=1 Tax=Streptomyces sp. NPDC019990 TaxID=3154693 RepID=UPI0033FA5BDD